MKKFFSLVLALVMALSLTTVAWGAVTDQSELEAAIARGGEVVLEDDITLATTIRINNTVTVDLAGYKLTGPDDGSANWYAFVVEDGGKLTLKDSSAAQTGVLWAKCYGVETKGGTFIMESGKITATNNATLGAAIVNYGGTVIVNGGDLLASNWAVNAQSYFDDAVVEINGGTLESTSSEEAAVQVGGEYSQNTETVTIDGGEIVADNALSVDSSTADVTVTGGDFDGEVAASAGDLSVEGGTFTDKDAVEDYLADGVILSANGSVIANPKKPVSTKNMTLLVPAITDLGNAPYIYWDADVELKKAEKEKDSEFATYTISMVAKVDDAPIWWDGGTEDEGEDVDFEWDGDDTFVKVVSADYAAFAVVKGSTITYYAPASWYNTDGWDEKAKEVTLPVLPDAEKDMKCCTNYAWDETRTTFYKVEDTLYRPATAADDPDDMLVFNVGGAAVIVVEAEVLNATRVDRDSEMAYDNLYDYEDDFDYVYSAHNYAVTIKGDTYGNGEVTKVSCDICKKSFKFVESDDVADAVKAFEAGNYFDMGDFEQGYDGLYLSISETSKAGKDSGSSGSGNYKPSTDDDDKDDEADTTTKPSTDKVTSAATFDAGIAMYVGMSVAAAAGSAVVIGKKKD